MGKASAMQAEDISDWLGEREDRKGERTFKKKDIRKMLRVWQERLEMIDFTIEFDAESAPHGNGNASIWMSDDYHYGVLRLKPGWAYTEPWRVNQKILHELMHVRLKPYDDVFDQVLDKLSPEMKAHVLEQRRHAREGVVEYLANAFLDAYGPIKGSA